ncbi:unnamed protein product [Amoebophrya sp. A25]|nr:unnamed protein product [Amoebophrya sp. A25]|eukprot:GSA25T00013554001.1
MLFAGLRTASRPSANYVRNCAFPNTFSSTNGAFFLQRQGFSTVHRRVAEKLASFRTAQRRAILRHKPAASSSLVSMKKGTTALGEKIASGGLSGGFARFWKKDLHWTTGLGVAVIEEFVLGLVVLGLACGVPGNTSLAIIALVSVVGFSWDLIGDLSLSGLNLGSCEQVGVEVCTMIHSSHCLIAATFLTFAAGN